MLSGTQGQKKSGKEAGTQFSSLGSSIEKES